MYELRPFIANTHTCIQRHIIKPGHYLRWTLNDKDNGRPNPYGCADACNILYSIGALHTVQDQRDEHIKALQDMQNPETGMFEEATHHTIHTTAHCLAALELFDAKGKHRLQGLDQWRDLDALSDFLHGLNWDENPWSASHQGAGIYASMVLNGEAEPEWVKAYFDWLWQNQCPDSGYWRAGDVRFVPQTDDDRGVFPWLASSFHYLFNLVYARMPLRYPEAMIDSGLRIWNVKMWPSLGQRIGFAEIDWVFCLSRALYQSGHRHDECIAALNEFSAVYLPCLLGINFENDPAFDDLHALFGSICCIAELQQVLPGTVLTEIPMRLVLNRRPFI
jgi:hypothetical protein